MKQFIGILLLFSLFSSSESFGQLKQFDPKSPNFKHDKMLDMVIQSNNTLLPDSVTLQLKDFAQKSGLLEANVMRNQALIRPIFNENFSVEDRLWACKIGMEMSVAGSTMPVKIFNDQYTHLKNLK